MNLAQENEQESAIECFSKSIDCNYGASGPFLNRGVVYYQLGMYEKAVKDYKKAIELETVEDTGSLDIEKRNLSRVYELIEDARRGDTMSISCDFVERYKDPELAIRDDAQDAMYSIAAAIKEANDLMLLSPSEENIKVAFEKSNQGIKMAGFIQKWFNNNDIYDIQPEEIASAFYLMNLGAANQGDPTAFKDIEIRNVLASHLALGLGQIEMTAEKISLDQINQIKLLIKFLLYHYNN